MYPLIKPATAEGYSSACVCAVSFNSSALPGSDRFGSIASIERGVEVWQQKLPRMSCHATTTGGERYSHCVDHGGTWLRRRFSIHHCCNSTQRGRRSDWEQYRDSLMFIYTTRVLAYEVGDDFMKVLLSGRTGTHRSICLVVEGSIPNENLSGDGYWAPWVRIRSRANLSRLRNGLTGSLLKP
jgi:hypothetical protein